MPAFRVGGKVVAGFAAFKNHLAYLPHSGSVLPGLADELAGYEWSSGSLHFAIDKPLPDDLSRTSGRGEAGSARALRAPRVFRLSAGASPGGGGAHRLCT